MTTAEIIAAAFLGAVLLTCLLRARLLAFAIVPPLALAFVQAFDLIDTSSASHPLRFLVPITSMSLAMWAAWWYSREYRLWQTIKRSSTHLAGPRTVDSWCVQRMRQLVASILVFASDCADIPALLAWRLPGEWVLVPLQIAACFTILAVLAAPERWFRQWT